MPAARTDALESPDGESILGIETSCDETSAAIVRAGAEVLSNIVSSQAVHGQYGGVVPELASREHLRAIVPVVRAALQGAGCTLHEVDAIAVTQGPGLAGALLVGISYAKAVAWALDKPLIAVNHLEGHIHAVLLEQRQRSGNEIELPALALVVSGGHTHLFLVELPQDSQGSTAWSYSNVGRTRDDAAGEAFDKVAKLLGLGYPGGPIIDALARHGDPHAVKFGAPQIKGRVRPGHSKVLRYGATAEMTHDFSFSGIKTAVLRYVELNGLHASIAKRERALREIVKPTPDQMRQQCDQQTLDLIASFQHAVVSDLVRKTLKAAEETGARSILVTGGVAANSLLREAFDAKAAKRGLPVYFPSRQLSTDNAAMIAAAAYPKFLRGEFATREVSAEASLALKD